MDGCLVLGLFISPLYMFQVTVCPSSGEFTVPMCHWHFSLCMDGRLVLGLFISPLYMFQATVCPSSELTVSMRHWYILLCMGGCQNVEALVAGTRETRLEVSADKTKYMVMSRGQNPG